MGSHPKEHLMVVFVREFPDRAALDAYLEERKQRLAAAQKPQGGPWAEPAPAGA